MKRGKGRKKGYVMSQESRDKISESRSGFRHTIETKEKIAKSLRTYFRKKNTLSNELSRMYPKCREWINKNKEALDSSDCKTLSQMRSDSYTEYPAGELIEYIAIDYVTPELLVLYKESIGGYEDE